MHQLCSILLALNRLLRLPEDSWGVFSCCSCPRFKELPLQGRVLGFLIPYSEFLKPSLFCTVSTPGNSRFFLKPPIFLKPAFLKPRCECRYNCSPTKHLCSPPPQGLDELTKAVQSTWQRSCKGRLALPTVLPSCGTRCICSQQLNNSPPRSFAC